MNADGYQSVNVKKSGASWAIDGTSREFGDVTHLSYGDAEGRARCLTFYALSASDRELALREFGTGIPGMPEVGDSQNFGSFVVAIDRSQGQTHCAVILRKSRDNLQFQMGTADGIVQYEIQRVDAVEPWTLYRSAARLARSLWKHPVNGTSRLYIGHAGACLVEQDGWRIMPLGPEEETVEPEFIRVSSDRFVNWAPPGVETLPSGSLLPLSLRDREARENVDADQLAKQCVTRWQILKSQSASDQRWHAHPLGLLLELAVTDESAPASPKELQ
jgi:hypothetical protein